MIKSEPVCNRCGSCCFYMHRGKLTKCRYLIKSGKVTSCRIYRNRGNKMVRKQGKDEETRCLVDRTDSPYNYPGCPYNIEGRKMFDVK